MSDEISNSGANHKARSSRIRFTNAADESLPYEFAAMADQGPSLNGNIKSLVIGDDVPLEHDPRDVLRSDIPRG